MPLLLLILFSSVQGAVYYHASTLAMAAAQEGAALSRCLSELDARAAAVIRTAFYEGVTYEALAQRLGAPLGTVKSWVRRGLLKLRACLER